MPYIFLISAFILNSLANLLLKLGSRSGFALSSLNPVDLFVNNWQFLLGCLFFVSNVPFYFLSLKSLPLSIAYPIMIVSSFILVNLLAIIFLKESINWEQGVGYALIILGLTLVVTNIK